MADVPTRRSARIQRSHLPFSPPPDRRGRVPKPRVASPHPTPAASHRRAVVTKRSAPTSAPRRRRVPAAAREPSRSPLPSTSTLEDVLGTEEYQNLVRAQREFDERRQQLEADEAFARALMVQDAEPTPSLPPTPARSSASTEEISCTICFAEPPQNPQKCVKCQQLVGCMPCINNWFKAKNEVLFKGCPLCRHNWVPLKHSIAPYRAH